MVNKKQIASGVAKFVQNDLIPDIDHEQLKFVLTIAKKSMRENPNMLDSFLDNSMIATVMKKDGDMYDIEGFANAMRNTIAESAEYPITIPRIPLLMNESQTVNITSADIDKIYSYIIGEELPNNV